MRDSRKVERDSRRAGGLAVQASFDKIHINLSFVFGGNFSAVHAFEFVFNELVSSAGNVDFAGFAVLLHAGSGVDGVAPDVVGVFFYTYNTCYYRPGVDADADLEFSIIF